MPKRKQQIEATNARMRHASGSMKLEETALFTFLMQIPSIYTQRDILGTQTYLGILLDILETVEMRYK